MTGIVQGVTLAPDEKFCPEHLRASIDAYVKDGRETGGFLRAVLENDLREAIGRADHVNVWLLPHIVSYLYNRVPSHVWGSPVKVQRHLDRKRKERS
jgi:hypothetical protein